MRDKDIILLELFSGTGGFAKGFEEAGFNIIKCFFSEVDPHAIANYKYNFKNSTYIGTVTNVRCIIRTIREYQRQHPRLRFIITFGSPCQNFSLAGNRTGLEGSKSSLIKYALFLIKWLRPDVYIWENVKGAYSTNNGADYWAIIKAFADIPGYGREQQLLNTSWVIPQNRERIYFVGHSSGRSRVGVFPFTESNIFHNGTRTDEKKIYANNQTAITQQARQFSSWCGDFIEVPTNTSQGKQLDFIPSDTMNTVTCATQKDNLIKQQSNIRRLTEIECERLQGFPDIDKCCIFEVCQTLNMQENGTLKTSQESKINADVEILNGKSIRPVGNVEKEGLREIVKFAQKNLNINSPQTNKPVRQNVLISCVEQRVEISSQGKLILSVSNAEIKSKLAPPIGIDSFVHLLVLIISIQEKIINNGEVDYPQRETSQIQVKNGKLHVRQFGEEIMPLVNYVSQDTLTTKKHTKYTILNLLQKGSLDMQFQILFSYVMDVIRLFIPGEIQKENLLTVQIKVKHGWTEFGIYERKVWTNKKLRTFEIVEGIHKIPKTQRYKLMGNAVTVKIVKIIAERIEFI